MKKNTERGNFISLIVILWVIGLILHAVILSFIYWDIPLVTSSAKWQAYKYFYLWFIPIIVLYIYSVISKQ